MKPLPERPLPLTGLFTELKRRFAIRFGIWLAVILVVTIMIYLLVPDSWRFAVLVGGVMAAALAALVTGLQVLNRLVNELQQPPVPQRQPQPEPALPLEPVPEEQKAPVAREDRSPWPAGELEALLAAHPEISRSNPDGIIVHRKATVLAVNPEAAALFGYEPAEMTRLTLPQLAAPDYQSMLLRNLMLKYDKPFELVAQNKDGQTLPLRVWTRQVTHNGQNVGVMTLHRLDSLEAISIKELQKTREELERRIRESSSELRFANERLRQELEERKRKEAELLQRNRELMVLQSAAVAITSSLDLRYVLNTVALEMAKLLNVERCTISEWRRDEDTIATLSVYSPEGWGSTEALSQVRKLENLPLTRSVLEDQIPEQMTIDQPSVDPYEAAHMRSVGVKTRMLLPMVFQRRVIGLVELEDSREERTFTAQEISLARLLANQAASAIENARLYQKAQEEIAERKQAEAALAQERALLAQRVQERTAELSKANAELARASKLKDEFLASMSHELRTPLNAILGSAEILQSETFGQLNEKQLKYAQNIEESGRHLLELINDILDLSKIEAGKMELSIQPVSVAAVCDASVRLVKQLAHKKQLQLSMSLDERVQTIPADERRLKQILVNLLSNAVKFTPEGGQIGLEVRGDPDRETVHFTVWDTGIGIAREDMDRLFQPFMQLDSSLSRQYAGTGLGLSLVSRMTELHGGSVSVESEPGKGSRFTVSLPWPEAVTLTQPEADTATLEDRQEMVDLPERPVILLAEDNEKTIEFLTDYLQMQGFQLVVARNGKEALERVKEEKPHLVLMDVQMPEMDGLEAMRRLRADPDPAVNRLPVIAITALAMPGDRERCLEAGANDYMSKPLSLRGLVQVINRYLGQRRLA